MLENIIIDNFDKFILSFNGKIEILESLYSKSKNDIPLTNFQVSWFKNFCRSNYNHLIKNIDRHIIDSILGNIPTKNPIRYTTKILREVRLLGDNVLIFRFPYNSDIIKDIKKFTPSGLSWYEDFAKVWMIILNHHTFDSILNIIGTFDFHVSDDVLVSLSKVDNISIIDLESNGFIKNPDQRYSIFNNHLESQKHLLSEESYIRRLEKNLQYVDKDFSFGLDSNKGGEASRRAIEHCLDNPGTVVLIGDETYCPLSTAVYDAYLNSKGRTTLIRDHTRTANIREIINKVHPGATLTCGDMTPGDYHIILDNYNIYQDAYGIINLYDSHQYMTSDCYDRSISIVMNSSSSSKNVMNDLLLYGDFLRISSNLTVESTSGDKEFLLTFYKGVNSISTLENLYRIGVFTSFMDEPHCVRISKDIQSLNKLDSLMSKVHNYPYEKIIIKTKKNICTKSNRIIGKTDKFTDKHIGDYYLPEKYSDIKSLIRRNHYIFSGDDIPENVLKITKKIIYLDKMTEDEMNDQITLCRLYSIIPLFIN